jgi:hypothetical protein
MKTSLAIVELAHSPAAYTASLSGRFYLITSMWIDSEGAACITKLVCVARCILAPAVGTEGKERENNQFERMDEHDDRT